MNKQDLIKQLTDLNIKLDWDRTSITLMILDIQDKIKDDEKINENYIKNFEIIKKFYEQAKKNIIDEINNNKKC